MENKQEAFKQQSDDQMLGLLLTLDLSSLISFSQPSADTEKIFDVTDYNSQRTRGCMSLFVFNE